jgi:hypothetical protein
MYRGNNQLIQNGYGLIIQGADVISDGDEVGSNSLIHLETGQMLASMKA